LPAAVDPRPAQVPAREWAVFSGDYGWIDEEGYLYFAGRRDEMIKTSGYRVSPTEIEEVLLASGLVRECCACGLENERLGQIIAVALQPAVEPFDPETLRRHCRQHLPPYQVPHVFLVSDHPLPRNPNGKLDRPAIRERLARHHKTKTHL
jgi:acyl-coenzyme A synthetase/AMP-(fatty) acid ligase